MIGPAALVDSDGVVQQRIVYDSAANYVPPDGLALIVETAETGESSVGYVWDGETFTPPPAGPATDPAVIAAANYEAMIRRRADALARAGDTVGALVLLHTIE